MFETILFALVAMLLIALGFGLRTSFHVRRAVRLIAAIDARLADWELERRT